MSERDKPAPTGSGKLGHKDLLKQVLANRGLAASQNKAGRSLTSRMPLSLMNIPEETYTIGKFAELDKVRLGRKVAGRLGIDNPFLVPGEGLPGATITINNQERVNFSSYNYLGLAGHPEVAGAAKAAIDGMGTSPGASRLVAGERRVHRELEQALAGFHGVEEAIVFVSGYLTNVSTIASIMRPKDLILHDRLAHNSLIKGAELSGAVRLSFPHNDMEALEKLLQTHRLSYQRVLIAVEGIYSMDGDVAPLDRLIELKQKYRALLMVDEAHSVGVLGVRGRGIGEHFDCAPKDVDIWMGTLSKTFAGCGGYVAGTVELIELLRYSSPGFVYSVGISPPLAAASLRAVQLVDEEAGKIEKLRQNSRLFLQLCLEKGLDCGKSEGHNIVPVIVGSSVIAAQLSNRLGSRGVHALPILYPAVEERAARLRFFVTSLHSEEQIRESVNILVDEHQRAFNEVGA